MLTLVTLLAAAAPETRAPAAPPADGFELAPTQGQAAAAAPAERKWTGSISGVATKATGNTDKTTAAANAQAENRGQDDRWSAQLVWNYSDEGDLGVTERRTYGQVKYDYFLSKQAYVFGVASGESDYKANLDLRATLGAGGGYQFREDKAWKISGEAGLSYVDENFSTSGDDASYLAARLAYKADYTAENEKWSAGQWGEVFPSVENLDDVSARVDTHARLMLAEKMFVQLQYIYSWDNTPATGSDRVDELWMLTFGWAF